jgi:hypothetical protein
MLVILATWEAEIRRTVVWNQPRELAHKTLSQKYSIQKQGWQSGSSSSAPA